MRVSLELRALICERERPQDDNLNCRGQRGEKIVRIFERRFFFFFLLLLLMKQARVEPFNSCVRKKNKTTTQKQLNFEMLLTVF